MARSGQRVDLAAYGQAVPRLLAHPSILIAPLAAATIALLFDFLGQTMTDPIGNIGSGIYQWLATVAFLCAFGIAIIQASHIWRGRRGSFEDAWQEGLSKFGGILIAAIGFQFALVAASYIGVILGPLAALLAQLAVTFFLIYTMAAASIGGLPGGAALSGSIRGVRANPLAAGVLTVAYIFVWTWLPGYVLTLVAPYISAYVSPLGFNVLHVLLEALILAYLAFPFAKQYDDVAFRGY
jgi:hypothetical protein